MNRKALIIGVPGDGVHNVRLGGVEVDLANYRQFLISPLGGAWKDSEIQILQNPTSGQLEQKLKELRTFDYALVTFSGHGGYNINTKSTHLELGPGIMFDSRLLKIGAPKQTVILDCCRERYEPPLLAKASITLESLASVTRDLDPERCRKEFDSHLRKCIPATIVLHACSIDEGADDKGERGGLYSLSLIEAAEDFMSETSISSSVHSSVLDVPHAHSRAAEKVRHESDLRQKPAIDQPRISTYFPFAVIA
jgi:hypothetical protein